MFPSPSIKPFERLQVTDGLLMNAERWRRAHEYHRQRQSLHYQSLNEPGIVCGLGVHLIEAPNDVPTAYRDRRWLQIQPGIAIDLLGNPIVIPEPVEFRIASETMTEEPLMVYLVVSYVDPETLRAQQQREFVQETYRIDERTHPPGELEVELCRILLSRDAAKLENPADVFFPGSNALDLRYRKQARSRSQGFVNLAQGTSSIKQSSSNLSYLLASLPALYPALSGPEQPVQISLPLKEQQVSGYDLIYLSTKQALSLSKQELQQELQAIKSYLDTGGILLIEAPSINAARSIASLAEILETPLESLENLSRTHPLRTRPFLFAALPEINKQPLQILTGGGIVLVVGELSSAWGLDRELSLSRSTIRTAQELGINILHFAWQRRQMTQLLHQERSQPSRRDSSAKSDKQVRSKRVFDKLID